LRTPCETEHDVTFSRWLRTKELTKKLEDNYVLSSPKAHTVCTRLLS